MSFRWIYFFTSSLALDPDECKTLREFREHQFLSPSLNLLPLFCTSTCLKCIRCFCRRRRILLQTYITAPPHPGCLSCLVRGLTLSSWVNLSKARLLGHLYWGEISGVCARTKPLIKMFLWHTRTPPAQPSRANTAEASAQPRPGLIWHSSEALKNEACRH